jgi:flagellar FliL protein
MATEAIEDVPVADEATTPKPANGGARNLVLLGLAGIIAGSAVGLFGVGPVLAKRRSNTPAPKVEIVKAAVTHALDNLVLNPAGSGGTRFLMVSAAFELRDANTEQLMKDHEAEVRDRILELLGKKTVDELTDPSLRDGIKKQVLEAVIPIFPQGTVLKVFFPQFVIQ